jgi:hypothetical protein
VRFEILGRRERIARDAAGAGRLATEVPVLEVGEAAEELRIEAEALRADVERGEIEFF